jgi:hypothetical protein
MTLYGDPSVKFGGNVVGGIKISHLSHIDKPLNLALTETRGKKAKHTIQPLPDVDPAITTHLDAIAQAATIDALKQAWADATTAGVSNDPQILAATNKRKAELTDGAAQ